MMVTAHAGEMFVSSLVVLLLCRLVGASEADYDDQRSSLPLSLPRPPHPTDNSIVELTYEKPYLTIIKPLVNLTKENGEEVVLKCEFRGHPQPIVEWYRNEAPIETMRNKIEIRTGNSSRGKVVSRLKIHRTDTHDTGFYKCEATNGFETQETLAILKIEGGKANGRVCPSRKCFSSTYARR